MTSLNLKAALVALVVLAGHPQLQVYFQTNLTDARYQKQAFDKVAKTFVVPKASPPAGSLAVVRAVIGLDGKLLSATLGTASGSAAWDNAALAAVKRAAPFPPLPKDLGAPSAEAHFHFTWGP